MIEKKRHKKLFGNSSAGFTLIELLVSIGVMALVSAMVFVNYRSGSEELALARAAQAVTQDIRRAAELTLQTEQITCGSGTISGYGLYVEEGNTSYTLFANCNGEDREGYNTGSDEEVESIALEDPVMILSVDGVPSSGTFSSNAWSVMFFPPDPRAVLCSNDSCNGNNLLVTAELTIALASDTSKTKTIHINETGFPDIQ